MTGANIDQKHVFHLVAGRDFSADGIADIAQVRDGDPAPRWLGSRFTPLAVWKSGMCSNWVANTPKPSALQVLDENGSLVARSLWARMELA